MLTSCYIYFAAPPRFIETFEDATAEVGKSIAFKCGLDGFPSPKVSWFLGSKEIHDEGRYLIERMDKQAVLEIDNIEGSDKGEYTCKIVNEEGEATCSAVLSVAGSYLIWQFMCILEDEICLTQ